MDNTIDFNQKRKEKITVELNRRIDTGDDSQYNLDADKNSDTLTLIKNKLIEKLHFLYAECSDDYDTTLHRLMPMEITKTSDIDAIVETLDNEIRNNTSMMVVYDFKLIKVFDNTYQPVVETLFIG